MIDKKIVIILLVGILVTGFTVGAYDSLSDTRRDLQTELLEIDRKVELAVNRKLRQREANMQLYVLSADNLDNGDRVHFYFRSDNNPFWRAHEIMEIEGINFDNLVIRESDLLEEANK